MKELALPRIVVAADDAGGRSRIARDTPAHAVRTVAERPDYRVSNIWTTVGSPATVTDSDRIKEITGLVPPKNGTVLRVIDYPPEPKDPVERKHMFDAMFAKLFPHGAHRDPNDRHPGMHATDTVDYAIVLSGEIYAVMDEGETLLKAGDILIQCGTNHGWSNRSNEFARIAFVLIDGKRG
jgi:mannose-6-phosphate isomerase-like protein (cupin superfamily)